MTKSLPPTSQIPQLNEAVQVNDSLRPAVLPWNPQHLVKDALLASYPVQDVLAEEVIEKVQNRIAEMMPELSQRLGQALGRRPVMPHERTTVIASSSAAV